MSIRGCNMLVVNSVFDEESLELRMEFTTFQKFKDAVKDYIIH